MCTGGLEVPISISTPPAPRRLSRSSSLVYKGRVAPQHPSTPGSRNASSPCSFAEPSPPAPWPWPSRRDHRLVEDGKTDEWIGSRAA